MRPLRRKVVAFSFTNIIVAVSLTKINLNSFYPPKGDSFSLRKRYDRFIRKIKKT